ncbi:hypothetical protein D3C81_2221360 [compost metagenome]
MEAVAPDAARADLRGQCECLCHFRLRPVEGGVEADYLGQFRAPLGKDADRFEVVWLVQGCERA